MYLIQKASRPGIIMSREKSTPGTLKIVIESGIYTIEMSLSNLIIQTYTKSNTHISYAQPESKWLPEAATPSIASLE